MTVNCANCNNIIPTGMDENNKQYVYTQYWNSVISEYYCSAKCSLTRHEFLKQGENNGKCIKSEP